MRFRGGPRQEDRSTIRTRGRVLIIVQNLSVPRDRRVWLECQALVHAGYSVSVICPMGLGDGRYQELDSVHIYRYAAPRVTSGPASFVWEFAYCWTRTLVLAARIWRRHGFDVIQACNPPDTYFAVAVLFKLFGVRFIFDQHDLCPELYQSRFAAPSAIVLRAVLMLERLTYLTADRVISTNESYRERALTRGHKDTADVTIVRNGPNTTVLHPGPVQSDLRRGRSHLCCWVGVMGPQDGVDLLVRAIDHYVNGLGRHDCFFALLGWGDCHGSLVNLVKELDLHEYVLLPGWADDKELVAYLSTADLGLAPDPLNPFNDVSTMNKTMEYMAFGLPVVTFDLKEARVSASDAALYVPPNDVNQFAEAIAELLDDPDRRKRMGQASRQRVESVLDWSRQVPSYVLLYDQLLAIDRNSKTESAPRAAYLVTDLSA